MKTHCRDCDVPLDPQRAPTGINGRGVPMYRNFCPDCVRRRAREAYARNPAKAEKARMAARRRRERDPVRSILQRVKSQARTRGIVFTLRTADILPLPTHCPVLGIPLALGAIGGGQPNAISVDRVDNLKGYVPGNVIIVSNRANTLKRDASVAELQRIAAFYANLESENA